MATAQSQADSDPRAEQIQRHNAELQSLQNNEKEIAVLIRQTEGEVERNSARRDQAAVRVREMEANIEQYARQEIGPIYAAAQSAELRVYVMKAQLELLQAKRECMDRHKATLRDILPLLDSSAQLAAGGDSSRAVPAGGAANGGSVADAANAGSKSATVSIIHAQEDERKRLSRQMHDGPAQSLTNLILQAEICERYMASDPVRGKAELSNLRNMVNGTFRGVREFIFDLRPMILDDLGLVPTLRKYIQGYQEKNKFPTTLTVSGKDRRLPQEIEVALFRAIQESLTNAAQHAKATQVQVNVDLRDDTVVHASIEDNGIGFDVSSVLQAARERRTQGIAGILDRVECLGGTVVFESSPGRGARVKVDVPL
jgi:two-component system, NarL family, sensor histidine kinase DegS